MFLTIAKIKHEELVDTIKTLKAEPNSQKGKQAILDLIDYFTPLISGILSKQLARGSIYRFNTEEIKNFIIGELTQILLERKNSKDENIPFEQRKEVFNIDQYSSKDVGKVINYIERTLKSRANKGAVDGLLGLTHPVTKKIGYYFNQVLKKFRNKNKREPVLEPGSPDLKEFAEMWKKDESEVMDIALSLGKDKIKSIYDTINQNKGGDDGIALIDTLESSEPIPSDILEDKEVADTLYSALKELNDTEYKVFMMYNDPKDEYPNIKSVKDIAKALNIDVKDVNRNLGNAKKKLLQTPKIKRLLSARQELIKFACSHFEVIVNKGTYRVARKNTESLIREIVKQAAIQVSKKDVMMLCDANNYAYNLKDIDNVVKYLNGKQTSRDYDILNPTEQSIVNLYEKKMK